MGGCISFGIGAIGSGFEEKARLKALKKGKSAEQKRCIDFFMTDKDGCLGKRSSAYTIAEYQKLVLDKCAQMRFKDRALAKIGLDESQVMEITPIFLSSFVFDDDTYVKVEAETAVSSQYSVSWIFFSDSQLFTYQYIFDTTSDNTWEFTRDYFYTDITCFTTRKMIKEKIDKSISGCIKKETIAKNNYVVDELELVVPGAKFNFSMRNSPTIEQSIQAAKAMIREKKYSK